MNELLINYVYDFIDFGLVVGDKYYIDVNFYIISTLVSG